MFNTLKYAKMLEEVGFSRDQAETTIKILIEVMEDKLATKQDIRELEQKILLLEQRLAVRVGTMMAASVAILTAIQKLA